MCCSFDDNFGCPEQLGMFGKLSCQSCSRYLNVLLFQLYREKDDTRLAMQAFDRARSIDPSLALPWAGMSADIYAR